MKILGIETSCDETAIAVVENGTNVLSSIIASSMKEFAHTGGVIPEEAARKQLECIIPVLHSALEKASLKMSDIDAIAVTHGPGLLGSLLVGNMSARVLARVHNKPLIGVHHTLGHLTSTWLGVAGHDQPQFPLLTLSVSGGHSDLWLRQSHTEATLLGSTRDDAAGEAFDKGAKLLELGYPGGPAIAKHAEHGNITAFDFPLPLKKEDGLDFSFSGLKTALRYILRDNPLIAQNSQLKTNLAASYQAAICAHLTDRVSKALEMHPEVVELHLVGGVSANTFLRERMQEVAEGRTVRFPLQMHYCTDNAAMIASAAYFYHQEKPDQALAPFETRASLALKL